MSDGAPRIANTGMDLSVGPPVLSIQEVARELGYSERTVRAKIAAGEIEHRRDGRLIRVERVWLDQYKAEHTRQAKGTPAAARGTLGFSAVELRQLQAYARHGITEGSEGLR